ncbi:gamma-mobile-trio protein GmtX [Oleiharenicola sp. Vm1]|uniref:gamma-mobile-trio protein GmtX n=1 Tax=Oleiharenicola sp. Vm1 TaxID=3398393 RepID=UPI0039F4EE8F
MTPTHPDLVLKGLLEGKANQRYVRNMRILQEVCRELNKVSPPDFSQATIGRMTASRGGPSLNTLYSPKGKHFRDLINAWIKWAGIEKARPIKQQDGASEEAEILKRVSDPAIRSYIGLVIAERRRLRVEVNALKQLTRGTPVIDMRTQSNRPSSSGTNVSLTTDERETLESIVDPAWLAARGLREGDRGELIGNAGSQLLGRGALPGIRKLLSASSVPGSGTKTLRSNFDTASRTDGGIPA